MQNFLDTEGANPGLGNGNKRTSFLNDGKSSGSIEGKEVSPDRAAQPDICQSRAFTSRMKIWNMYMWIRV